MTVKELIELNPHIVDIRIELRGDEKSAGKLVDQLNIGPAYGIEPPYPTIINQHKSNEKKATYIHKSINARDDGKDYFEIKPERLPAKWLELTVTAWRYSYVYHAHHRFEDLSNSAQGITITTAPAGYEIREEEKKEKPTGWEHLEGQLSIFDMEG